MKLSCRLERWTRSGCAESDLGDLDVEGILQVVAAARNDWSTTVHVERSNQTMSISVSHGKFAVMLQRADDDFFDLLASKTQRGWDQFVHGGQPAEHPRRHIVNFAGVGAALRHWARDGTIESSRWERQAEQER
jgi:hypothetical protein